MDQEKIGKFIAERREHKKINQKDLANKIGVTNKAISKWENGRGMPDYSLFKPLCKELDITVSELLNGELDKNNKTNKDEVITNYLSYKETIQKKKNIRIIFLSIIIFIILTLTIYFINSYKKISIYELSGQSANFKYQNGLLVKSNIKTIIELGTLTSNTITKEQIVEKTLAIKINNKYYFISNIVNGEVISEEYGYGEYLNDIKLKYVPKNLYIIVWYKIEDEIKAETIKIANERHLLNDKLLYEKKSSIDNNKLGAPINLSKYNQYNNYKDKLAKQGFKETSKHHTMCDQSDCYEKEVSNNEYIAIQPLTKRFYYTKKEEKIRYDVAYIQHTNENGYLSMMNIKKREDGKIKSIGYDFNTSQIVGQATENDKKTAKKILELYNEYIEEKEK